MRADMHAREYPVRIRPKRRRVTHRYAAAVTTHGIDAMGVRLDQRRRLLIAGPLGMIACSIAAFFCPWQLSVLAGWDVAATFVAGSVWTFIAVLDAAATERVATREDDSRTAADVIMVAACLISIVGVVAGLAHARAHSGLLSSVLTGVAVFTVFLSWFTVHTLFVLRYARLYYGHPSGGIEFANSTESPDYMDFAYVAFTVGMTFQVSDTGIQQREIRRTVIRHAVLSYVFGTVIVGIAINVVGNLIR
jgi:uncharacterized membrane protein